jgi:hypothetical protein
MTDITTTTPWWQRNPTNPPTPAPTQAASREDTLAHLATEQGLLLVKAATHNEAAQFYGRYVLLRALRPGRGQGREPQEGSTGPTLGVRPPGST